MKKNGFTLIELLAVIIILAIILAIIVPSVSGIIKSSTKGAFESDAKMVLQAVEYKLLENDAYNPTIVNVDNINNELKLSNSNYEQLTITTVDNKYKVVIVGKNKWAGLTAYGTMRGMNVVNSDDYDMAPPVITVLGTNPTIVEIGGTYTEAGATASDIKDGDVTSSIVTTGSVNTAVLGAYTITYTVEDATGNIGIATRTVNVIKVGTPVLATGMIPIKWNGSTWVDTTVNDDTWFNYTTTDKQWPMHVQQMEVCGYGFQDMHIR